jgi:hypothetical protein
MGKALAALLTLCSSFASAATFYVGKNGNDSNTCDQAQSAVTPKLTINGAFACTGLGDLAGAGHTVELKAGSYDESLYTLPGGASWDAPFTLRAAAGESVTIKPTTGQCAGLPCGVIWPSNVGFIIFEGLVLDSSLAEYNMAKIDCDFVNNQLVPGTCAHHFRFKDCEVVNPKGNAFFVAGDSNYNEFLNLKVHGCGKRTLPAGQGAACFNVYGDYNLVDGCEIYDSVGQGISS